MKKTTFSPSILFLNLTLCRLCKLHCIYTANGKMNLICTDNKTDMFSVISTVINSQKSLNDFVNIYFL